MPLRKRRSKEVICGNIRKRGGRRNNATAALTSVDTVIVKDR